MKYIISEEALKERRRLTYLITITLPLGIALSMFIICKFKVEQPNYILMLIIGGICSAILFVTLIIVSEASLRKAREISLTMDGEGVDRSSGNIKERINYVDIVEITALYNPKKTKLVQLTCKGKDKAFMISGYENIEEIRATFENAQIMVKEKIMKVDWANPLVFISTFLCGLLVLLAILLANFEIYMYMMQLTGIGFGIYTIKSKNISKRSGIGDRKFEIISGALMIVCSLLGMVFTTLDRIL